jgi:septal ring factor EnvC (AmiA/AmiB activator)|tara:strand:+ start:220 stop:468 length:249 start_codon:yes stop_codon:yes gene_type:complete
MKSLETQELEDLRSLSSRVKNLKEEIADIEVNLSRLNNKKPMIIFDIENAADELTKLQNELQEKYGNVVIDLNTGEIKDGQY